MNNYVLYGYGESVASNVVRLALAEKNISYDYKLLYLESRGDHLKDDYKKLNPIPQSICFRLYLMSCNDP